MSCCCPTERCESWTLVSRRRGIRVSAKPVRTSEQCRTCHRSRFGVKKWTGGQTCGHLAFSCTRCSLAESHSTEVKRLLLRSQSCTTSRRYPRCIEAKSRRPSRISCCGCCARIPADDTPAPNCCCATWREPGRSPVDESG